MKIWDIRTKSMTQSFYGPMTQGDTLDMQSDSFTIATAGGVGGATF